MRVQDNISFAKTAELGLDVREAFQAGLALVEDTQLTVLAGIGLNQSSAEAIITNAPSGLHDQHGHVRRPGKIPPCIKRMIGKASAGNVIQPSV